VLLRQAAEAHAARSCCGRWWRPMLQGPAAAGGGGPCCKILLRQAVEAHAGDAKVLLRQAVEAHAASCIRRVLDFNRNCPVCRHPQPRNTSLEDLITPNRHLQANCRRWYAREYGQGSPEVAAAAPPVRQLYMQCPHSMYGCGFQSTRSEMRTHLKQCPFEALKGFMESNEQRLKDMQSELGAVKSDLAEVRSENTSLKAAQGFLRKSLERRSRLVKQLVRAGKHQPDTLAQAEFITIRAVMRDDRSFIREAPHSNAAVEDGASEMWVSLKVRADTQFARIVEVLADRLKLDPRLVGRPPSTV
ncbi:hypothetical protein CYMTET_30209, partial [Cymbomonas tetramitiformis]